MNELNLTELEKIVMNCVIKECFYDNGFASTPWLDCFLATVKSITTFETKITRAIISSLSKKNMISVGGDGRDKFFELEENGKKYLLETKQVDANGYPIKGE